MKLHKLLIDENLSPDLAERGRLQGHDARHVRDVGRLRWPDEALMRYALTQDRIIVTNNGRDFIALYAREELHPGLVIILPRVTASRQLALFDIALAFLETRNDLINQVMEIDIDGNLTFSPLHGD